MKIRRFKTDTMSLENHTRQQILDKMAEEITKAIPDDKIINATVELTEVKNYVVPRFYATAIVVYRD